MKRIMVAIIGSMLLLGTTVEPALAQGGCGCGRMCWRQNARTGPVGAGFRNGTGPRAQNGTCPFLSQTAAQPGPASNAVPVGRGLRNGMGPRALNGTCPYAATNNNQAGPSSAPDTSPNSNVK